MKAIIVGGGIGGLTTALMLRARGIDCELYEQGDAIRELGVGINTLPHAIRELAGLGLLDKLDAAAYAKLAEKSRLVPIAYYSAVAPRLFDSIIAKYTHGPHVQAGGAPPAAPARR